jgi:hypothetical protein
VWDLERKELNWDLCKKMILPIGFLSASSIALGNHALMHLSVSFAQMLKALAPVYILILLSACSLKTPSRNAIYSVIVISLGTAVASIGEVHFSPGGVTFQILADLLEAVKIVLIQIILSGDRFSVSDLIFYVTPVTGTFQLLLISILERKAFTDSNIELLMSNWPFFAASASLGLLLSLSGPQVIKVTSALTLKLIGIVRNNLLVMSAIFLLGERTSGLQFAGYLVSAFGFVCYALLEATGQDRIYRKSPDYGSLSKTVL